MIDLYGDIKNHVVSHWKLIIMSLAKQQLANKDEYGSYLVVTVPTGYIPFEQSVPKPAYWTFCLITNLGKFFLLWSDHIDGVASRMLAKPLSLRSEDAVGTLQNDVVFLQREADDSASSADTPGIFHEVLVGVRLKRFEDVSFCGEHFRQHFRLLIIV